ncbi:hypothetical protein KXD40_000080 [Peronospora effusa]|nr:hypothetical protein KXD40_000080 [Peronospora effusa]
MKLLCAIVGREGGSAFSVRLDDDDQVADLKDEIKAKNEDIQVPARNLRLFLAKKTDGAWLKDSDPAAEQLFKGELHPQIQQMIDGEQAMATRTIKRWLFEDNKMSQPLPEQIHVLVVSSGIYIRVTERTHDTVSVNELRHYQNRGELIQRNCTSYCQQIITKIEELYTLPESVLPFICVEGSSGMGKSQLAFALGGSRPWFYWPTTTIGDESQRLYKNFSLISNAFDAVTNMDEPKQRFEKAILNTVQGIYETESLWTFGFILALLKYCSKEQNQHGKMMRFQEETSLHVEKCLLSTVVAFREKMKAENKVLPFFVLDEMTPNMNIDGGGKNLAAFQRNVFRVCGLVVIVMGTDAKITNLVGQAGGSYTLNHSWMTIISRFPPYQAIPFADKGKEKAWNRLQAFYPVLKSIVVNSRGRFARYFVDSAAQYAVKKFANGIELCDLLDVALDHVSLETQKGKHFMGKPEGMDAQLMAISYTNVASDDTSPPPSKKRKTALKVGTYCMHLHFANLVDDQATEVKVMDGQLKLNGELWKPFCCFPDIDEDVLLYLAIMGGKTYSGYYDREKCMGYSTLRIFSEYLQGRGRTTNENTNAISNDYKTFENMVAHMIFCASRRNGVQGIPFDEFFAGLLSECQDEIRPVAMTIGDTEETIVASNLLDTYADLATLSRSKIPFLAPPNAEWPSYILDTRAKGCNFGHLVRTSNAKRCDILVHIDDVSKPLFLCECKFWNESVGSAAMKTIIGGLETIWKEKWVVALVFCVKLATFEKKWERDEIGCVKVNCRSGRVNWVFQPEEEKRKKLVIVMETGPLTVGCVANLD